MALNPKQTFTNCVNQALLALQKQKNEQAQALLQQANTLMPNVPDVLHLLGVSCTRLGDTKQAKAFFKKAIAKQANNPQFHNSYGNLLAKNNDIKNAINSFETALKLKSDYTDPYINLGNLLLETSQFDTLKGLIKHWQIKQLKDSRLIIIEAKLLSQVGEHQKALALLERENQIQPNKPTTLHALAIAYRVVGQPEKSLALYQTLEKMGMQNAVFFHNYANALSDIGELQAAINYYVKALSIAPFAKNTHENLCDLRYELGQNDSMFSNLYQAVNTAACPAEIFVLFIAKLIRISEYAAAKELLNIFKQQHANNPSIQFYRMLLAIKTNENSPNLSKQLAKFSENTKHDFAQRLECTTHLIAQEQYSVATPIAKSLVKAEPNDQLALSLLYLCLRAQRDDTSQLTSNTAHPVANLKDYVFEYIMSPPDGFSSTEAFMQALASYLESLHTAVNQPLEQTLHKGTQTRGNLFNDTHPYILHIQQEYKNAVAEYVKNKRHLPELYADFWSAEQFSFAGSWSVLLHSQGYHSNHIHPMGWLSSACYIHLPDTSKDNQGWFKYGEPNLPGNQFVYEGIVEPTVGKLVLFPSCLWHGTIPFSGEQKRITIACDMVQRT